MQHRLTTETEKGTIVAAMEALDLKVHGMIPDDFVDHFQVLVEAQRLYQQRYSQYKDRPIRAMGWRGCLMQARTCAERLWSRMLDKEWVLDDALDGINYFVHYVRQGLNENIGWEYPGPQELDNRGPSEPGA